MTGSASPLAMTAPHPAPRNAYRRAGRLKQSVSYWPYGRMPLAEFAPKAKAAGVVAVDLLQPEEWPVVKGAGLVCSMGYPSKRRDFLSAGFNDPSLHDMLVDEIDKTLPLAAAAGVPNIIAMFGNRKGRSDEEGAANCITGLNRVKASAERHGVTVCVELLNSRVDHKDYMGDHTAFGVKVVSAVNSSRVKLLYDIYHMQIMEGDVIRTIRDNLVHIGHFHTGGVPGRHEIDGGQELNYTAVCKAIADAGFQGYVAHEFMPSRDPLASLAEAVKICEA
ncbi:MAG: TIM barrel protein [Gemmatimonadales bacterium]|nr:TIM barrel protein [Gemmatimonadales bacterium]